MKRKIPYTLYNKGDGRISQGIQYPIPICQTPIPNATKLLFINAASVANPGIEYPIP